jgi:hypothetical protein
MSSSTNTNNVNKTSAPPSNTNNANKTRAIPTNTNNVNKARTPLQTEITYLRKDPPYKHK